MRESDRLRESHDSAERPEIVEPGSPALENALFVLLGAASTVAVILRFAGVV